ncbi:hypothetical protein Tsubulata_036821 [Turnera subulata]|uniref:RRM domain-containing protein n=1 Tax=Turnera subulata TaxID=218843 RepID=A0A9Q0J5J2_9ROSI|nr:hypothetical protein Tsubulata_036821 [Turnera subulata]
MANFPDRWLPTDLHLVMSRFGDVMDIFIPQKLNRNGNRYAFVRFKNNTPTQDLVQRIVALHVDGASLEASVARGRPNSQTLRTPMPNANGFKVVPGPISSSALALKSFAEAVDPGVPLTLPLTAYQRNTTLRLV